MPCSAASFSRPWRWLFCSSSAWSSCSRSCRTTIGGNAVIASLLLLHGDGDFAWTRFDIHPSVLIGCIAFGALYAFGITRGRKRGEIVASQQIASFMAGIAVLFVSLNGPIHELSDYYLFSAHMVQHLLLTLVMPPLLLIGTPDWLLRSLLRHPALRAT